MGQLHLHHNHREGENVPFLARSPFPTQELWCGPPRSVAGRRDSLKRDFLIPGVAEIRDACATITINQNIGLQNSAE